MPGEIVNQNNYIPVDLCQITENISQNVDSEGLHQVLVSVLDEVDGVEQGSHLLSPGGEDGSACEGETAWGEHEASRPVSSGLERMLQACQPPLKL